MQVRREFIELADAIAAFQRDAVLTDGGVLLLLRTHFRRGRWPKMMDDFFDHQLALREANSLLHLRYPTSAMPSLVMLLELVIDSRVAHHVTLQDALTGEGGIVYPYALESAPDPVPWHPHEALPPPPPGASAGFVEASTKLSRAWARANVEPGGDPGAWLASEAGREARLRAVVGFMTGTEQMPEHYAHDVREPGEIVSSNWARMSAHAWKASWDLWSVWKPQQDSPLSVLYFGPDGDSVIEHRVSRWLLDAAEVVVTGASPECRAQIFANLQACGLLVRREEIVEGARAGAEDRELSLNRIGLYGFDRREDAELEAIAQAALTDPDSAIRRTAVQVAIHLGYPSLKETLLRLVDQDPSEEIRAVSSLATRPVQDPSKICAWERRAKLSAR